MPIGYAELTGTIRQPELIMTFNGFMTHPSNPRMTMLDWVRAMPGRRFEKTTSKWHVTGVGPNPDGIMAAAGIEVIFPDDNPEFAGITELGQLYMPVSMLGPNGRIVYVRHRFAGYDDTLKFVGAGATWDKKRGFFKVPVGDLLIGKTLRPNVIWDPRAVERAVYVHSQHPAVPGLERAAQALGSALTGDSVPDEIALVESVLGTRGDDYGVKLFGYQEAGHLAVAAGHTGLFDAPGVGKTTQFLAAAKVMASERTIIVCPPLVLTNWARETVMAGNATEDQIAVFLAGKKEPSLEGKTVVIIGDSLIASRPETVKRIVEWNPTVLGYDEAHRAKTFGSKRSEAILDMVAAIPGIRCVAITGTPMFAGPHELVPLLELTGHLVPIFGGHAAFLARYCTQDRFGGWHARKEHLGELRATLVEHVWVRRTKEQVLPDLPPKRMAERVIDVDIASYKQAHKDVMEKLTLWLEDYVLNNGRLPTHGDPMVPDSVDEIQEYAQESIRFVSMLRRAAGLAKVKGAAEHIQQFVEATTIRNSDGTSTYTRPLIVWTHHEDVTAAMADAIPKELGPTGVIKGGTSNTERNRVVDEFQAGRMPVIVGSITAAGVGITLTRSSDVLFVETDWTPALVGQAIDRAYRFGQTKSVLAEFLIALGTLDEHIQKVLIKKAETLATVMGDSTGDMSVTQIASDDLNTATDIMVSLIDEAITIYSRKKH